MTRSALDATPIPVYSRACEEGRQLPSACISLTVARTKAWHSR